MMSMFIWNRKRMRRVTFNVINQMMKWAPLGVFALIGVSVSKFGLSSLSSLGKLVISVYGTMVFFVIVVLGMIAKLVGYSIFKLLKGELLFDFSTASSEAVLPRLMAKVEGIGVQKHNSSFIIPTGYSFTWMAQLVPYTCCYF